MAKLSLLATFAAGILGRPQASLDAWLGVPISLKDGEFWRAYANRNSWSNASVSVNNALQLSTVWACVRLIAETIATLPLGFYERKANGSRKLAPTHPLYNILHNQPNADMAAVFFWEAVVASLLLWGNTYIEIMRLGTAIVAINFLHPARVTYEPLRGGGYQWRYRDPYTGAERIISEENMMHIPAFSLDGRVGLSPIVYGVNVFGTAMDTDKASATTFKTTMRSPGVITMDMVLKKEQREEIREHIKDVNDRGGVMVLEKGSDFHRLGLDPASAELLNSRKWNVEEMCRWYRVDPSMVGFGGKDSNWGTGLEQKMLWFLTFTLRHWCVRIEQAIRKSLLTPVERTKYFAEFNMEGLLRGDSTARKDFYTGMVQNGIFTRDECRVKENLEPKGGNADVLTVQVNMAPLDQLDEILKQKQQPAAPSPGDPQDPNNPPEPNQPPDPRRRSQ